MVLTMRGIGDCTFEVAVQVLEMQRLQMMQSPMAGSVKRAVKVLPSLLVSVLIASARVTVRAVPLGTVAIAMVRARVPALGLMELEPPRARDATRRRLAAFRVLLKSV